MANIVAPSKTDLEDKCRKTNKKRTFRPVVSKLFNEDKCLFATVSVSVQWKRES